MEPERKRLAESGRHWWRRVHRHSPVPAGAHGVRVLGINAISMTRRRRWSSTGETVAAAEEERFSRRKHGKRPVPFSAWELPEKAAAWCLEKPGWTRPTSTRWPTPTTPPSASPASALGLDDPWDHLRISYAEQAPGFLAEALPGLDPGAVRYVRHHEAHAASAGLAGPFGDSSVLVSDGRGEAASHLAGHYAGGTLRRAGQPGSAAFAGAVLRAGHRAPGLPALQR